VFPGRDAVLAAYADGVAAVVRLASGIRDWAAPTPCAGWDARDLAGHVLCVADYYNRLLDAALAGNPRRDLPRGDALTRMNAADLAALPDSGGPGRVAAFQRSAGRHRDRLHAVDWDLVLGSWQDLGPLTVGAHAGLAVGEWHLHAWDFARAAGGDHEPADPATVAAGRSVLPGAFPGGPPWAATLRSAGRVR
jgi:uncharacterized protein (TIGR03083 family)